MSQRKEIFIKLDDCVGCLTCVLACAAEHSQAKDIFWAMLEKPSPITRISVEAADGKPIPLLCRHCEDAPCVEACMSGSMQRDPNTQVVTNQEDRCIGCWMCLMACPYGVIFPGAKKKVAFKCDLCPGREAPACVDSCPMEALEYKPVEEFIQTRRRLVTTSMAVS